MPWFWQTVGEDTTHGSESTVKEEVQSSNDQKTPVKEQNVAESLTSPTTWISTAALTSGILALVFFYRRYVVRIPSNAFLQPRHFNGSVAKHKHPVFGVVTSVGDADNFRLYHTPLGRLVPFRSVPKTRADLRNQTLHIRLAGCDAPELAHFGKPAQPKSGEALEWLANTVLRRRVRCYIHRRDQYDRVVATVHLRKGWLGVMGHRNVGLDMVRAGWATVYEAKYGVEFGGQDEEKRFRDAERLAKKERRGIWGPSGSFGTAAAGRRRWFWPFISTSSSDEPKFESPRAYKNRMTKSEERQATKDKGMNPKTPG